MDQPPSVPPRDLTPRARWHSWSEPSVRAWCIVAAIVALTDVGVGFAQWLDWHHDARLSRSGDAVDATLVGTTMESLKGQKVQPGQLGFLRFTYKGQEHVISRRMPPADSLYVDGSKFPIRVDPDNPEDWTLRVVVPPLVREMIGFIILLPIGLLLTFIGLLARWRVLRVWRLGVAREAVVIGARNTALSPGSRILRCANVHGSDKRLFNVLVSKRDLSIAVDDTLWVVSLPNAQQPALPVAAYQ